jgi:hypothetical protein
MNRLCKTIRMFISALHPLLFGNSSMCEKKYKYLIEDEMNLLLWLLLDFILSWAAMEPIAETIT